MHQALSPLSPNLSPHCHQRRHGHQRRHQGYESPSTSLPPCSWALAVFLASTRGGEDGVDLLGRDHLVRARSERPE